MTISVSTIGDSITANGSAWRARLQQQHPDWVFVGSKFDGTYWHDGVGGDSSQDVLDRLGDVPPCDIALVLIGTNDWHSGIQSTLRTARNNERIAATMAARGTTVYVLKLLRRCDSLDLNVWNKAINSDMDTEVVSGVLLNTWSVLTPDNIQYNTIDCLHPNTSGYNLLGDYVGPLVN